MKDTELEIVRLTEANLLGCLLIAGSDGDSEPIEAVKRLITVEDFLPNYRDGLHRRIYLAMTDKTDQISVANQMNDAGTLQKGDIAYMSELIFEFVSPLDYRHYAELVAKNAGNWRHGGRAKPRFSGVI